MNGLRLGIVGAGSMADAIVNSILKSNLFLPAEIIISDVDGEKLSAFRANGLNVTTDNAKAVLSSDIVILAVKPQIMEKVLGEIAGKTQGKCLVSIAAGISVKYIVSRLGDAHVVRAMPNTPMLLGKGATAMARTDSVPEELYNAAVSIFSAAGAVEFLDEEKLNEVIGVSGSSPAYFFRMADAMVKAAAEQGIEKDVALRLAAKAMEGAAKMLLESGRSPKELTAQVTSPGGTTFAALTAFDELGFDELIEEAMKRCTKRAYEIGK